MIYIWTNTYVGSSKTVEGEGATPTPNEPQDANAGNANMQSDVDH